MDSIIRGTNATIQIKIREELDFSTIKIYVTDSTSTTATRFRVGIRYKYKVFY